MGKQSLFLSLERGYGLDFGHITAKCNHFFPFKELLNFVPKHLLKAYQHYVRNPKMEKKSNVLLTYEIHRLSVQRRSPNLFQTNFKEVEEEL